MIKTDINGIELVLKTSKALFSPSRPDKGTLFMLSKVNPAPGDKILDLGCGYGIVGIYAAKIIGPENVFMLDIDPEAVKLAKENAELNGVPGITTIQSNGFEQLNEKDFTLILSNPPYHSDFSVAKHFIEKGFNRLCLGGRMFMVTKRREWYEKKFTSIFGGVKIHSGDGYLLFESIRKNLTRHDKRQ